MWNEVGSVPIVIRSPKELASFFEGWSWSSLACVDGPMAACPGAHRGEVDEYCAVGRKP
jgi:hypothetical protein